MLFIVQRKAKQESSSGDLNISDLPSEIIHLIVSFCEPPELSLLNKKQLDNLNIENDDELDNSIKDQDPDNRTHIECFDYAKNIQMYNEAQHKDTQKETIYLEASDKVLYKKLNEELGDSSDSEAEEEEAANEHEEEEEAANEHEEDEEVEADEEEQTNQDSAEVLY